MSQLSSRLFLGFKPALDWTEAFVAHQTNVKHALQGFEYRWVPPANYHLTLHYFGACTPSQRQHLLTAFSDLRWKENFILPVKTWALMGQRSPRSLTLAFLIDPLHPFLQATQNWVAKHVGQSFVPASFRPHVTFGKHKGRVEVDVQSRLENILASVPAFDQPLLVSRCALFETRIQDKQASYVPLTWT